jgi:hypothetical protein
MTTLLEQLIAAGLPAIDAEPGVTPHFSRPLTLAEEDVRDTIINPPIVRQKTSRTYAQNIPNWSTWTEAQADAWYQTNVRDPYTAATTLVAMKVVIGTMITVLWILVRMVIALRDQNWPDLPDV